jgi:methylenetetrahydrofolate--tRNA-(uracil-5-)-methyltransferase
LKNPIVHVIGAGLAGVEASYQLTKRGINVKLYEMKKIKKSQAHKSDNFAELVCSNSFRSNSLQNAAGVLKEELRILDSLVIKCADEFQVPAGSALAVDRDLFSEAITKKIRNNPLIEVIDEEVTVLPEGNVIIATGPLTSDSLFNYIKQITEEDELFFFDAAAPIIEFDSIDMTKAYFKSRYDKGEATYINCPMTKEEYDIWYDELIKANCVVPKDFELKVFEGCMPFEEIAKRGYQTLLFGPMKPVGLRKADGSKPFAVVQLRQDNATASLYNIVGFQTHLTFPEQLRIIRLIPGLEKANIIRYGVMHRNTYINAPKIINEYYQMKKNSNIFFAGQLSGVEGYVESVGSAMVASINMANMIHNEPFISFPLETALGSQAHYLATADPTFFQPMNANFGLFPPLSQQHFKKQRKDLMAQRSLDSLKKMMEEKSIEKR